MVEGNCFPRERIDPFTVKGRGGTKPRKGTTRGHLDSPFDQITRLEDGRFRDSNPIAPKQSISSSFRISISPLSTRKIILQNSDQSSLDLSYHDLPKIVSQYLNLHSRIDLKIIYIYIKRHLSNHHSTFFLERKSYTILANRFKSTRLREKKRGSKVVEHVFWRPSPGRRWIVGIIAWRSTHSAKRSSPVVFLVAERCGSGSSTRRQKTLHRDGGWLGVAIGRRRGGRGTSPKDSLRLIMAFAWVAASFWRCRFHPPRIMPRHEWRPQRRRWLRPSTRTFVFQCLLIVGQTDPHTSLFVRWTWAPFPVFDPSHRFCFSFRFPFQRSGNSLPAFSSFFDLVVSPDVVKFVRIFVIDEGLIFKLTSIREQFYYSREFSLLKDWYLYLLFNFWSRG